MYTCMGHILPTLLTVILHLPSLWLLRWYQRNNEHFPTISWFCPSKVYFGRLNCPNTALSPTATCVCIQNNQDRCVYISSYKQLQTSNKKAVEYLGFFLASLYFEAFYYMKICELNWKFHFENHYFQSVLVLSYNLAVQISVSFEICRKFRVIF